MNGTGYCARTCDGDEGDCAIGDLGTWPGRTHGILTLEACAAACRRCSRCRYVSYSSRNDDCSWFHSCSIQHLGLDWGGDSYTSLAVRPPLESEPGGARWRPRAARGRPLLTFRTAEERLIRAASPASRVQLGTSWLDDVQASNGVVRASTDPSLACFVRAAERRPVRIAAIGGSVTAGLAWSVLSGAQLDANHILYHRKLALWLNQAWPSTQRATTVRNCGLPGAGPAFAALCLQSIVELSVLTAKPDLVLLEFAVNAVDQSDVGWLELLLRQLHRAGVAAIVVNAHVFGDGKRCVQQICAPSSSFRYDERGSLEPQIERLAKRYRTPLVSLRRAVFDDLGTPPVTLSNFMRDCKHPSAQGHSWLAQLIVEAMQQAVQGGAMRAQRCRGRRPPPLPPPLTPLGGLEVGGGVKCLHAAALHAALVGTSGFWLVNGTKPGLRSVGPPGSWLRLRLPIDAGEGASVHLGFLQSWRPGMGAARVRCEAPCACPPLALPAHDPTQPVSVTKIRALHVQPPAAVADGGAAVGCVLRLQTEAGGKGGAEFMLSHAIVSIHRESVTNELKWLFHLASHQNFSVFGPQVR